MKQNIKIGSFNISRCYDNVEYVEKNRLIPKPNLFVNALIEQNFDIVGLQEVDINRNSSSQDPADVAKDQAKYLADQLTEKTGVKHYYAFGAGLVASHNATDPTYVNEYGYEAGKSLYGVALLSKYPILRYRAVPLGFHEGYDPDNERTYLMNGYERRVLLIVDIQVGDRILTVINSHFDLREDARDASVPVLQKEVEGIENPVIFMGDLNSSYDEPVIQGIANFMTPTTNLESHNPPTAPTEAPRVKIDWIFTKGEMEVGEFMVSVDCMASDHFPVWVEVTLK